MKQVDFYLINNDVPDAKLKLASRLSNKLQRLKQSVLIHSNDQAEATLLDKIMWSFSDTSFVPHELIDNNSSSDKQHRAQLASEVHIAAPKDTKLLTRDYDVLINLHQQVPVFSHHFTRIAEVVSATEEDKTQARQRYKEYQQQGFELQTHTLQL